MLENSNELLQKLSEGNVDVKFEKADGSIRRMVCTTKLESIPEEFHPKGESISSSNNRVAVFDVDICAWRSFNIDRVQEWNTSK